MTRLDRAITLGIAQPLLHGLAGFRSTAPAPTAVRRTLPILMYHSISDEAESGISPYYRTVTSPGRFREQMQWLSDHGYRGMTLQDGLAWLNNSQLSTLNSEPVAITFDDGFRDFYTNAFPILSEHSFNATMFLPTAFIGNERRRFCPSTLNSQLLTGRPCLSWSEVRELHAVGIEFGSHTVNHPKLVGLGWDEIESELRQSKTEIETHLGTSTHAFAYPYAFPQANLSFVKKFRNALTAHGYENCVTTEIGRVRETDHPFRLKRLPVNETDDRRLFVAKLRGAYDWLSWPQRGVKALKSIVGAGVE